MVDWNAGARISIPGHARGAPLATAVIHIGGGPTVAALVAWLRLIRAGPTASPTPDLLTSIGAAGAATAAAPGRPVDRQRGATDREDAGRRRGILCARAAVPSREGDGGRPVAAAIRAGL